MLYAKFRLKRLNVIVITETKGKLPTALPSVLDASIFTMHIVANNCDNEIVAILNVYNFFVKRLLNRIRLYTFTEKALFIYFYKRFMFVST